jgi:hypothetical protein
MNFLWLQKILRGDITSTLMNPAMGNTEERAIDELEKEQSQAPTIEELTESLNGSWLGTDLC